MLIILLYLTCKYLKYNLSYKSNFYEFYKFIILDTKYLIKLEQIMCLLKTNVTSKDKNISFFYDF